MSAIFLYNTISKIFQFHKFLIININTERKIIMGFFSDIADAWREAGEDIAERKRQEKEEKYFVNFLKNADKWAENGNKEALWVAMRRYMYGSSGIMNWGIRDGDGPIDFNRSIKYGEIAIRHGIHKFGELDFYGMFINSNESVELMIAWCYLQLKEYGKAEYWYEKAYEQGEKWALFKVGEIYVDRTDGKNDYEKAIKYFEKSIKNDWFASDNEFMIARLHYEGKGFPEDKAKGLEMIRAAAKKGSEIAKEYMKKNDLTMGGMLDD